MFIIISSNSIRFWSKVRKTAACWEWTSHRDPAGYGRYHLNRIVHYAHRLSYEAVNGSIPAGLELDHTCRNRGCVNPYHLEAVTHRENILRGESWSAKNSVKSECSKGHPYDEANTFIRKNGWRGCRICRRERPRPSRFIQ